MPPSLATYQQQANQIYEPEKAAEAASLNTKQQTSINTLEAEKPQIQADYQTAIDNLSASILKQTGKINQLYTERLGGNFSGLQGNDIGMMYSSANKLQAGIETTRANKLAQISTEEGNVKLTTATDIANLGSKYQSLESRYANEGYSSAVKEYDTQQQRNFTNKIALARLNLSASRASKAPAPKATDIVNFFKTAPSQYGDYNPDSTNYHRWQAAEQELMNQGLNPQDSATQKLLVKVFGSPSERAAAGV